jgi:hypothetical protein
MQKKSEARAKQTVWSQRKLERRKKKEEKQKKNPETPPRDAQK